jgi:hypothetical protein
MAMGAVMASGRAARSTARAAGRLAAPFVRVAVDPPLVPYRWRPISRLERWGRDWQDQRGSLVRSSVEAGTAVAADAAEVVLPLVDLTPLVNGVLDRLDLDAIAASALDDLDLTAVVDQVIDELDVGDVLDRALGEVDLTEVVVEQVDLGEVVDKALDDLDLTQIVLTRVDLTAVVNAVVGQLDLTALVQDNVDLAEIAEQVMDDIDLPQIIQESTGSVASEAVQSARLSSVNADDALSRFADRLLLRRRGRGVQSGAALDGELTAADADAQTSDGAEDRS